MVNLSTIHHLTCNFFHETVTRLQTQLLKLKSKILIYQMMKYDVSKWFGI